MTIQTTSTWGHNPISIDCSEIFRIVLQNPNGLKIQNSLAEFALGNKICHSLGAGAIALTETNINWNQTFQLHRVSTAIRDLWETTSFQPSQHPEAFRSQLQRGGTLQIITDRWVSRIQSKGINPYGLGRWSYTTLKGKGSKTIVLITAYRPCKDSLDGAGDKTVYMQHFRTLLAHANTLQSTETPNPYRQFILGLQAWIEMLQNEGYSIILCLDGNENISCTKGSYHPLDYNDGIFIKSMQHYELEFSLFTQFSKGTIMQSTWI